MNLTKDSYPYVTGMGFRNRSHMIFDEFYRGTPEDIKHDGQIVFVKTDLIPLFFDSILPKISRSIIILTHNSALGIDNKYKKYLDDPRILKWYAQNANFEHPKLCSIPLGIANQRWPHGDISQVNRVNNANTLKDHLVYMNFDLKTNVTERTKIYNIFKEKDYVLEGERKPFGEYLEDLSRCKYTLSPPGAGIDCHRIWESIAVGTIPIVQNCHNISFYSDMPILIIDDWNNLNKEYLEDKYITLREKQPNVKPLYMDYWIKKIGLEA